MGTLHVMDHPLVAHKMTIIRNKHTSVKDFRELVSEIGMLITYEATRDLPLTTKTIETPLCKTEQPTLAGKKIAVCPILRAGLGLWRGGCHRDCLAADAALLTCEDGKSVV